MEQIFFDYQNKDITGDTKLQEEYARRKGVNQAWVRCEDITVRQLINNILDEFEEAGFDLEILPIENVLERFLSFKPETVVPIDYIQLQNAKTLIEEQISKTEVTEFTAQSISTMKDTLDSVNEALKGYK